MSKATKNFVFVLNNYTEEEVVKLVPNDAVRYIVYQREVGEETGTPHLQGYLQTYNRKRFGGVHKATGVPRLALKIRNGSHEEARAYCLKEETRAEGEAYEEGDPVTGENAGKRTDLELVKAMLDDGRSLADVADAHFGAFCRHSRGFREYQVLKRPKRDWITHTTVIWGPSGVGKTRRAMEEGGPDAYWISKPNSKGGPLWLDGYDGQETVIIDEFYGWIARDLLQRMCDRYPLLLQCKGGSVSFLAKRIIITSNCSPTSWWKIGLGAMERRLCPPHGRVIEMDGGGPAGQSAGSPRVWPGPVPIPGSLIGSTVARRCGGAALSIVTSDSD